MGASSTHSEARGILGSFTNTEGVYLDEITRDGLREVGKAFGDLGRELTEMRERRETKANLAAATQRENGS